MVHPSMSTRLVSKKHGRESAQKQEGEKESSGDVEQPVDGEQTNENSDETGRNEEGSSDEVAEGDSEEEAWERKSMREIFCSNGYSTAAKRHATVRI